MTFCDSSNAYTFSSRRQSQNWQIPSTGQKSGVLTKPVFWHSHPPRAQQRFQTRSPAVEAAGGTNNSTCAAPSVEAPLGSFRENHDCYTGCGVTRKRLNTTMRNTGQGERERMEPALPPLCPLSKDHLSCQGMNSIPKEKGLLALLTYVTLKKLWPRGPPQQAHISHHFLTRDHLILAGSTKNPTLHISMFLEWHQRGPTAHLTSMLNSSLTGSSRPMKWARQCLATWTTLVILT